MIVLAGGDSTKFSNLGEVYYGLLKILDKYLIEYSLNIINYIPDIENVIVLLSRNFSTYLNTLQNALKKYNAAVVVDEGYGSAYAVYKVLNRVKSEFTIICDAKAAFLDEITFLDLYNNCIFGYIDKNQESQSIVIDKGKIVKISDRNISPMKNLGVYIVDTELLKKYLVKTPINNNSKKFSIKDTINVMLEDDVPFNIIKLDRSRRITDLHKYIETTFELLSVNYKEDKIKICNDDIEIIPPVYIGKDVKIEKNCVVGPNVIVYDNAKIGRNCIIENSIIMENVRIYPFCHIKDSLVGSNTIVYPFTSTISLKKENSNKFVIIKKGSVLHPLYEFYAV